MEANRLTVPGERAALERVEAIAGRIDGLRIEMFAPSRQSLLDPDEHARLATELRAEADRCGRRRLLDDVTGRVGDALRARLSQPLRYDPVVRYSLSPTRPDDEAIMLMTVTDAAAVAVMEDRLRPETAQRLSMPGRVLLGLSPLGESVASVGEASSIPEPSDADWTAAAIGDARVGGYTPMPVGLRVVASIVTAIVLGSVALFAGVAIGQTGAGILAALAVVAVCWLVATYHR
jgi:hypothetical protein